MKASSLEVAPDGVAPAGGVVNYSAPVSYPVGFYIESGGVVSDPLLRRQSYKRNGMGTTPPDPTKKQHARNLQRGRGRLPKATKTK